MAPVTLVFVMLALLAIRRLVGTSAYQWSSRCWQTDNVPADGRYFVGAGRGGGSPFSTMGPVSYYDITGRERVFKLIDYPSEWHALDRAFEWLRRNAAPSTIVATTVPHLAYLRTGHKAVLPPFERNEETANRLLAEVPVSYVVIDRFGQPGISERYLRARRRAKTAGLASGFHCS